MLSLWPVARNKLIVYMLATRYYSITEDRRQRTETEGSPSRSVLRHPPSGLEKFNTIPNAVASLGSDGATPTLTWPYRTMSCLASFVRSRKREIGCDLPRQPSLGPTSASYQLERGSSRHDSRGPTGPRRTAERHGERWPLRSPLIAP